MQIYTESVNIRLSVAEKRKLYKLVEVEKTDVSKLLRGVIVKYVEKQLNKKGVQL